MVDGRSFSGAAAYDSDATERIEDPSGDSDDIESPAHDSDATVHHGDSDTDGEGILLFGEANALALGFTGDTHDSQVAWGPMSCEGPILACPRCQLGLPSEGILSEHEYLTLHLTTRACPRCGQDMASVPRSV